MSRRSLVPLLVLLGLLTLPSGAPAAKDQNGQPVREEEGSQPPCPTITLNKK